ncbi:VCBS repeat-containing protein [Sediminicola luteus]|uniref:ASPIC/UnbV domain-containing protein n=1 Tax=Sediminicola luteus TaxID=319238 RepID=A0A2A4G3I5_9FLAO|nr:VCBS repeat-containing protein [Sediminicola luteus]PCE62544.1 hypothetical protein B7P33_18070 [Sediminicola luteus]
MKRFALFQIQTTTGIKATLLLTVLILMGSCQSEQQSMPKSKPKNLLEVVPDSVSGISFANELRETEYMNGLFYEYFYNGSGVAVGDFNNDGLEDIYFVSTLSKNKLYLNQGNLSFKDITQMAQADSGKGFESGVTTVDINQDGLLDLYICRTGRFQDENKRRNALLVNIGIENGVPKFEERASQYGLDLPNFSTQAGFFDYDRDGDLDMFLINHGIDTYDERDIVKLDQTISKNRGERLYRNDKGHFVDVTEQAGIINHMLGYGLGLSFGDLNNDQWPDIYVANDFSGKDHLYINQQNGTFLESVKGSTKHISNFSMGTDIADSNNDGWLDIIAVDMMAEDNYGIKTSMSSMDPERFQRHVDAGQHYQYMYNSLQLNQGVDSRDDLPKFSDIAQLAGVASSDWSWAPLFLDLDNDGNKDLFISNGIKRDFRNNDFVKYRQKREHQLKQGQLKTKDQFVADLLNRMPARKQYNKIYLNQKDLSFSSVPITQPKTSSNGAAYADFDNDGDLDLVVNNSDDASFIYKNNQNELDQNHYLKIKLNGPNGNRNGIGARITIQQEDQNQIQEFYASRGFQSASSRILHFGLGTNTTDIRVQITWPSGKHQEITDVTPDQLLTLEYKDAHSQKPEPSKVEKVFSDISHRLSPLAKHQENIFNDFEREELLPHRMSTLGPALAVGDVNGDGLDDFFLGGAKGFSGQLFVQESKGTFSPLFNTAIDLDKKYEDMAALFFDYDNDGDQDLIVVSGGNEAPVGSTDYQDRLYENQGKGTFSRTTDVLPSITASGGCIAAADYDADGDLDLFIGGRQHPGQYPLPGQSLLLENLTTEGKNRFLTKSESLVEDGKLGMVTDAIWADMDNDNRLDLVVLGEWMAPTLFMNRTTGFEKQLIGDKLEGWWSSLAVVDLNNDGLLDLIGGNLGVNYKYKATSQTPFEVFADDFDENGTFDIVLGYYDQGKQYPLRGRECSSNQMPFIKKKFADYNTFGMATLSDVLGNKKLENAYQLSAYNFASTIFINQGKAQFVSKTLPAQAQFSSVNGIVGTDLNQDGLTDLILAGNLYGSEIETPRNDASYGQLLFGSENQGFKAMVPHNTGLFLDGDVKQLTNISIYDGKALLVAPNNGPLQLIKIEPTE